jgi:hypothetical protein
VTAVESLVAELSSPTEETALARRIGHLATNFDFDALRVLADAERGAAHART